MKTKKVAIFTGNRAEYGLQYPIIKAIRDHPKLEYNLIVSGAHLEKNFGNTLAEIKSDGFKVHKEVLIEIYSNNSNFTSNAIGSGIISISKALNDLKPDILLVYADRYEGFAATIAATQMNIPTAHIEGGDLTEGGALDDSVRHAMTKLSHIHFTTNDVSSVRVRALGEEKWRIFTVGFPAIDLINEKKYANKNELVKLLGINIEKPIIILTQHSVTTEYESSKEQIIPTLNAMTFLAKKGYQIIITYPNNDVGSDLIVKQIEKLKNKKLKNIFIHKSLGRYNYHGVLALSLLDDTRVVCLGNSSSGIKETPAFGCPTVNIGSRQKGRLRGNNVIDVNYDKNEIIIAINKCINDKAFIKKCKFTKNPYFKGGAGKKIANILYKIELTNKIIRKKMTIKGITRNGWYK